MNRLGTLAQTVSASPMDSSFHWNDGGEMLAPEKSPVKKSFHVIPAQAEIQHSLSALHRIDEVTQSSLINIL